LSLDPETKLGAYEIVEKIGEGGMGQVYRARDAALGRDVALKVLPESMAADGERVGRFRREAKLLAALSHQNVASIHGFDEDAGRHYLVMELVDGEPLDRRLKSGPLDVQTALEVGRQVCEGLEAAHAKGIVHRDLKPANVIVRSDGQVKILDFGLAKALADEADSASALGQSPTLITAETAQGVLLGTAAYMSPEQARGKAVDARTDTWAFGALLFEMLSGVRAFAGETVSDCLALVLQGDPDWTVLPADTPPAVRMLLRRCLTKDARRRQHAIADARIELESVLSDPAGSTAMLAAEAVQDSTGRVAKGWGRLAVLAVALLAVSAGVVAGWVLRAPEPVQLDVDRHVLVLDDPERGLGQGPAISPDGRSIAYLQERTDALAVLSLDTARSTVLRGVSSGFIPEFSPDGKSIVFYDTEREQIRSVPARGGPSTVLVDEMRWLHGHAVTEEGGIYFSRMDGKPPATMHHLAAGATAPVPVEALEGEEGILPAVTPDGQVLFVATRPLEVTRTAPSPERCSIEAVRLSDGARTLVLAGATRPRWSPSGHVVAVGSGGALTAVPFDVEGFEVVGDPVVVERPVSLWNGWLPAFAIGADGTLVYLAAGQDHAPAPMSWLSADGSSRPLVLPDQVREVDEARLSPDGLSVALIEDTDEITDLWIHALDGSATQQLGDRKLPWDHPVWSPDGRWVFATLEPNEEDAELSIWRFAVDRSAPPQKLLQSKSHLIPLDVSPDGEFLVYSSTASTEVEATSAMLMDLETLQVEEYFSAEGHRVLGRISPDGRWFACTVWSRAQQDLISVRPFGREGRPVVVAASEQSGLLGWTDDSSSILYWIGQRGTGDVRSTSIEAEPELRAGASTVIISDRADLWKIADLDSGGDRFLWRGPLNRQLEDFIMVRNFDEHLRRVAPPSP
jgi:serine/threonine protein kinase